MKITNDIITRILACMLNENQPIVQEEKTFHLCSIVSRLNIGLNDLIAKADQMEHLKKEQAKLDSEYVDATDDIKAEIIQLQEECPHFSYTLIQIPFAPGLELGKSMGVNACDICGKHL